MRLGLNNFSTPANRPMQQLCKLCDTKTTSPLVRQHYESLGSWAAETWLGKET